MNETTIDAPGRAGPEAPRRVGRRTFLKVTAPAVAALVAAASGVAAVTDLGGVGTLLSWYLRGARNYLASYSYAYLPPAERIKRHFDHLTIDEAGLQRFVRDFERHYGKVKLGDPGTNRILYTKFLLSSDFFRNGADERRTVHYVAMFDPYITPCWVPFAPAGEDRPA